MTATIILSVLFAASQAGGPPACEVQAHATRISAVQEAHAEFWLDIAGLANQPAGGYQSKLAVLQADRDEALALAESQYRARLRACALLGHGRYRPDLAPDDFLTTMTGGWFPMRAGTVYRYERRGAAGVERIESTVVDAVVTIVGVPCRPIDTVETLDGALVERTTDWFAQHRDGGVWYFGELSQEYQDGLLISIDGSWRTGVAGALPGMVVPAAPTLGQVYRMEFLIGSAEDIGRIVGIDESVSVPAGNFDHCLAVEEWSPLEPADIVVKYYAPQVGMVLEVDRFSGERLELIEIR